MWHGTDVCVPLPVFASHRGAPDFVCVVLLWERNLCCILAAAALFVVEGKTKATNRMTFGAHQGTLGHIS